MNPAERVTNGSLARVLIVDDNCDAAQTTGMWLEIRGHKVNVLTDSTQCLSRLEAFNPDVLLLDIAMPTISGYDLARRIRSQAKFENLAIIAISGYADAEHTQRSLDFGCDQHLVKPVDLESLERIIVRALEKSG